MSKKDKLIRRLLDKPSDFKYDEAKTLLYRFGYEEDNRGKSSGSRVAFIHSQSKHIIRLHKPHPSNLLKLYQINELIKILKMQDGFLDD